MVGGRHGGVNRRERRPRVDQPGRVVTGHRGGCCGGAAERIQLRRTAGWRKPEGAIVVSRPGPWGNPFLLSDVGRAYPSLTMAQCHVMVVQDFRGLLANNGVTMWRSWPAEARGDQRIVCSYQYPTIADVRANLAGHDLACWCPLVDEDTGEPVRCHADVLLTVAAGGDPWDVPRGWPPPEDQEVNS